MPSHCVQLEHSPVFLFNLFDILNFLIALSMEGYIFLPKCLTLDSRPHLHVALALPGLTVPATLCGLIVPV